jgi:hypothetical protein
MRNAERRKLGATPAESDDLHDEQGEDAEHRERKGIRLTKARQWRCNHAASEKVLRNLATPGSDSYYNQSHPEPGRGGE